MIYAAKLTRVGVNMTQEAQQKTDTGKTAETGYCAARCQHSTAVYNTAKAHPAASISLHLYKNCQRLTKVENVISMLLHNIRTCATHRRMQTTQQTINAEHSAAQSAQSSAT